MQPRDSPSSTPTRLKRKLDKMMENLARSAPVGKKHLYFVHEHIAVSWLHLTHFYIYFFQQPNKTHLLWLSTRSLELCTVRRAEELTLWLSGWRRWERCVRISPLLVDHLQSILFKKSCHEIYSSIRNKPTMHHEKCLDHAIDISCRICHTRVKHEHHLLGEEFAS